MNIFVLLRCIFFYFMKIKFKILSSAICSSAICRKWQVSNLKVAFFRLANCRLGVCSLTTCGLSNTPPPPPSSPDWAVCPLWRYRAHARAAGQQRWPGGGERGRRQHHPPGRGREQRGAPTTQSGGEGFLKIVWDCTLRSCTSSSRRVAMNFVTRNAIFCTAQYCAQTPRWTWVRLNLSEIVIVHSGAGVYRYLT